jgi:hypothetical protein
MTRKSEKTSNLTAEIVAEVEGASASENGAGRCSQADELIAIGRRLQLFNDGDGSNYALTPLAKGRARTVPITTSGLGSWLRRQYFVTRQKGVTDAAMTSALSTLSSLAEFEGAKEAVFVRLGVKDDAVLLDLADDEGNAVEITAAGWTLTRTPTVRFWQPPGMKPLPIPQQSGRLHPLWDVVNVEPEDRVLVAAWLLMALNPWGPYPGLFLHGQQGSAKSTTAGFLRRLIDPNRCPLRQPPRDEDALVLAARNGLIVGLDNLSHIDQELSDSLCRLMTGGGIGKRKLYTDSDEVLLDVKRPLLVTGIPELATAGDLADRAISLSLPAITDGKRLLDRDVSATFGKMHAGVLGVLLDGVVLALKGNGSARPATLSRMADFEVWACAGLPALGFDPQAFLDVYRRNQSDAAGAVLESSPVAAALLALMDRRGCWNGTAAELMDDLRLKAGDNAKDRAWPRTPRGLSGILRRLAPALLTVAGLSLKFGERDGHDRRRVLSIERSPCKTPSAPSAPSADVVTTDDTPF